MITNDIRLLTDCGSLGNLIVWLEWLRYKIWSVYLLSTSLTLRHEKQKYRNDQSYYSPESNFMFLQIHYGRLQVPQPTNNAMRIESSARIRVTISTCSRVMLDLD